MDHRELTRQLGRLELVRDASDQLATMTQRSAVPDAAPALPAVSCPQEHQSRARSRASTARSNAASARSAPRASSAGPTKARVGRSVGRWASKRRAASCGVRRRPYGSPPAE